MLVDGILDGKTVAKMRREALKTKVEAFIRDSHRAPGLAVVLVGDDPASEVYVKNKIKAASEAGMASVCIRLKGDAKESEVIRQVEMLNQDLKMDGILVQLPLPRPMDSKTVIEALDPKKDADGLHPLNLGRLVEGTTNTPPCTPAGVIAMLEHYQIPLAGKHAVVVGRSNIVGKPMAQLLLQKDATVTICHSRTHNLQGFTRQGDVVIVAAGRPEFLGRDDFKKDAVVVDVGIHRKGSGLCGDVRFSEVKGWAKAVTPVPGGVGPMTIAMLLENTYQLALSHEGQRKV